MAQTQSPLLTREEVRYILEGIQPSTLTRDEIVHALTQAFGFEASTLEKEEDVVGVLQMCLGG